MILPHIIEIANICAVHGITDAVISPGSRSAAISLAFEKHPSIQTRVIIDERSAAFIGMGMAQQQQRPVVLICTSGSASLNYAPAIAEAYYQEIPLIVLTADRPPEWIDQYDGQTINQQGIYGKHVLSSYQFPVDAQHPDARWYANSIVNEAILAATDSPSGPVHINVPIREPFYPENGETISFAQKPRIIRRGASEINLSKNTVEHYGKSWSQAESRWIIIGQMQPNERLTQCLKKYEDRALIINEVMGNQHGLTKVITNPDLIFKASNHSQIKRPDLLITLGNSLISKNLKIFLRKHPPNKHWHIKEGTRLNDSLQHLTETVSVAPETFFEQLYPLITDSSNKNEQLWQMEIGINQSKVEFLRNCDFGELRAIDQILQKLPDQSNLHLANSMSVRYANYLRGFAPTTHVFCNRGTSGIDGSNSTAVGASFASERLNVLVTGDLAFFYDRNAFWHREKIANLRVVLLNNNGGGIFNMIPGPKAQQAYEKLFLTPHGTNASYLAKEFGIMYHQASNQCELASALDKFFSPLEKPQILEIFSSIETNTAVLEQFRKI